MSCRGAGHRWDDCTSITGIPLTNALQHLARLKADKKSKGKGDSKNAKGKDKDDGKNGKGKDRGNKGKGAKSWRSGAGKGARGY